MEHKMVQLMSQLTDLSEEEIHSIEHSFPIKSFKKGTLLLQAGQIARDGFYVIEGCIREYILLDGEEKTTGFYTEDFGATDFASQSMHIPSNKNFVCMEDCTVVVMNDEKEKELYKRHPRFETFCREGMEQQMGEQQEKLAKFMVRSPKERYLNLLQERPYLLQRVPQYHLATYLGVKPETLSRIRKRIASKEQVPEQS